MPTIPKPLRRLSIALKFTSSYNPSATPDTALASFLSVNKDKYINDVRRGEGKTSAWIVGMGNEAGDLDTIASSIAISWLQTQVHENQTIPYMQFDQDDLALRAENIYALSLAGLKNPREELLFSNELNEFKPFPSQKFILVDHNQLGPSFSDDNAQTQVIAVVDHHDDEGLYKDTANPRIISPSGSCASHVAQLCPPEIPAELATLLLCAIFIDTGGLKPGGKALQVDRDAAAFLIPRSTFAGSVPSNLLSPDSLHEARVVKDVTAELSAKKEDVSRLSAWDLLRRDYKEYTYDLSWAPSIPSIKAGLSTVPVRLQSWSTNGRLEKDGQAWMTHRGLSILGVLTSFRDSDKLNRSGRGKHKREMVWIVKDTTDSTVVSAAADAPKLEVDQLASRLWTGLEASEELKLKQNKKFSIDKPANLPASMRARVYKQKNADATRKTTAPLLKSILEGTEAVPLT